MLRRAILLLACAVAGQAQTHKIVTATYSFRFCQINVTFDGSLSAVPEAATVHDTNQKEVPGKLSLAPGGSRVVEIRLTPPCPKSLSDVVFPSVSFTGGATETNMSHAVLRGLDATPAFIKLMAKVPQTQEEKNIFASGLVTTASTGTAGAADVHLNSPNLLSALAGPESSSILGAFPATEAFDNDGGRPEEFRSRRPVPIRYRGYGHRCGDDPGDPARLRRKERRNRLAVRRPECRRRGFSGSAIAGLGPGRHEQRETAHRGGSRRRLEPEQRRRSSNRAGI
jgi:hypothetical protein